MSYIGSTPISQNFIAGTDYFNGTGSAVNFTMSRAVNSVNDIEVLVNNVAQIPSGYLVSGTTLTFSVAPSAGTSNVYVRYLSTTNLSLAIPAGTSATFNTVTATSLTATSLTATTLAATNLSYTGTLTGNGGIVNIGSGQVYKDASGNVGIGTTAPFAKLNAAGATSTSATAYDSTSPPAAGQIDARSTDAYTTQRGGKVTFSGIAGTGAVALSVYGAVQGYKANASISNAGGGLILSSTSNASGLLTEAARIDDNQNLLVGTTSALVTPSRIAIVYPGDTTWGIGFKSSYLTGSGQPCTFVNSSNTVIGYIGTNGTATSYSTSSDYRLKEDIVPMTGALAKVQALNPVNYKWKLDASISQGFIAHELQAVVPECVTGEKDAMDAEGNPQYQGIDTSFLVATLTAALQELKAIIDTQATRITALEAK